ncbi:hypothetical protein IJT17_04045 [bacterium]|nr:hypothetical protein [bacterium]
MSEDYEIRQIIKFSGDGPGKASVSLRVGPLVIHGARIMDKDGHRWLAWPSRPSSDGKWFHLISCESKELMQELEQAALEAYDSSLRTAAEAAAAL